jgi:hypothetical protein
MLTKEMEEILREQAKRIADKYIPRDGRKAKRDKEELFLELDMVSRTRIVRKRPVK